MEITLTSFINFCQVVEIEFSFLSSVENRIVKFKIYFFSDCVAFFKFLSTIGNARVSKFCMKNLTDFETRIVEFSFNEI